MSSDKGGEYTSTTFNEFCTQEGLKINLIVPYIPQHNGFVERKKKEIVGVERVMLHD